MGKLVPFVCIRDALRIPTNVVARLADCTGANVRQIRPGRVDVDLSRDATVKIRVARVNIYEREAGAYLRAGKPVPAHVVIDLERWKKEHGD